MAKKRPQINHVETIPEPEPVEPEPVPALEAEPVGTYGPDLAAPVSMDQADGFSGGFSLVPYGNGQWAASDDTRGLMVWVGGVRYEHVSETPDGRWVYTKS